ncbi:hypothetical protein CLV88_11031 [Shimia abyssi]|uniref:Uncharacterized protein n=1 Tax=Shimia abyssi TaxID=1662395 RepID=A0A2P8F9Q5_9RHOB|nr:hypothetical protein CLV88_11031 [Shimia abyssi]
MGLWSTIDEVGGGLHLRMVRFLNRSYDLFSAVKLDHIFLDWSCFLIIGIY